MWVRGLICEWNFLHKAYKLASFLCARLAFTSPSYFKLEIFNGCSFFFSWKLFLLSSYLLDCASCHVLFVGQGASFRSGNNAWTSSYASDIGLQQQHCNASWWSQFLFSLGSLTFFIALPILSLWTNFLRIVLSLSFKLFFLKYLFLLQIFFFLIVH